MKLLLTFVRDEKGATSLEYAMIGSLLSILIITGVLSIGTNLHDNFYNKIAGSLK